MSKQVDEIIKSLRRGVARAVAATTLEVHARLVEATPVDTGWARANWVPSVGKPHPKLEGTPPKPNTKPGAKLGAGQAAVAKGIASLAQMVARAEPTNCYVTNNVKYVAGRAPSLDSGHSKQAPAGFIRKSIADAVNEVAMRYAGKAEAL